jgi:hypothetical protein
MSSYSDIGREVPSADDGAYGVDKDALNSQRPNAGASSMAPAQIPSGNDRPSLATVWNDSV